MPFHEWPSPIAWLAALLAVALLADALRRADWRQRAASAVAGPAATGARHDTDSSPGDQAGSARMTWGLATLAVLAARMMTVTTPDGLTLKYLGAAWLALLLGYPRAVVSLGAIYLFEFALACVAGKLPGGGGLSNSLAALALPLLLLGIAPAWLIWLVVSACRRWLPANLFVFLIGVGFLGLQLAYGLPLLAAAALTALLGGPTAPDYWQTMLPFALLLVAGEAWLEGFLVTLLVVFAPHAVRLYDGRHYLPRA
jgi:uncharacterized membrane protein